MKDAATSALIVMDELNDHYIILYNKLSKVFSATKY